MMKLTFRNVLQTSTMLYQTFGFFVRLVVRQFFRTLYVTGAPQVTEGPVIITPNHPNQAVDPFIIGTVVDRPLSFLAKSTIFTNPLFNYIFHKLNMIPVYRRLDKNDPAKNEETFKSVADALTHGKAVVIFPEGTSTEARKLLPLKTGAARMAFLAESNAAFALGVKIQPVSITYSDPYTFQSSVTVAFGDPIMVGGYKNLWLSDQQQAVKELTHSLDEKLRILSLDLNDLANQPLIEKIARLFSSSGHDDRERFKEIASYVESLAPKLSEKRQELERRIDNYLDMASVFNLEYYHPYFDGKGSVMLRFAYLLLSPVIILGISTHAIPYYSIRAILRLFRIARYNYASAKMLFSMLLFPIWYGALYILISNSIKESTLNLLCIAAVILSGYLTNKFFDKVWLSSIEFLWPTDPDPVQVLTKLRDELRAELREIAAKL